MTTGEAGTGGQENSLSAREIISYIAQSDKKTPVTVYIRGVSSEEMAGLVYPDQTQVFAEGRLAIVFGDWALLQPFIQKYEDRFEQVRVEAGARNSALPLLDLTRVHARIEPGALIRDRVTIKDGAVIMMGAILNIGAYVGEGSLIDMGAVLGGRAAVGKNCHIGAGAVLAGVIEPASAQPVRIGDQVLIGANAVVLEGVQVGDHAVVAAGAVVTQDVEPYTVVAGVPARVIKSVDAHTESKTAIEEDLRRI